MLSTSTHLNFRFPSTCLMVCRRSSGRLLPQASSIRLKRFGISKTRRTLICSCSIESLAVKEGELVEQGAPLYTLDVDTATKGGDVQRIIADVLRAEREMLLQQISRK